MTKGKNGGKRPGAGRKVGSLSAKTLDKLAAREFVREQVTKALAPMLRRQIAHAMGIGHLYTRDKTGKFTKIEDEKEQDRLLAEGVEGENYWIFTKDPSVQAFTDLVNRAIDKPKEQEIEVKVTGDEGRIARLLAGRKRAKDRKGE
jgi:hypothetical protein